uniref:Uncharacterized protein n=1 Tax=Rhipicephalus zambeziensis TaxID=60191 RepID=A0A224YKS7_9ACAR
MLLIWFHEQATSRMCVCVCVSFWSVSELSAYLCVDHVVVMVMRKKCSPVLLLSLCIAVAFCILAWRPLSHAATLLSAACLLGGGFSFFSHLPFDARRKAAAAALSSWDCRSEICNYNLCISSAG